MKRASEIVCRNEVLIALEEKRKVKWKQKEVRGKRRGISGLRLADYKEAIDERKKEKEVREDLDRNGCVGEKYISINTFWILWNPKVLQSWSIAFCCLFFHQKYCTTPPPSLPALCRKELPYDYNALNWSPAFFPTGEHSSGLSARLLLIFHPIPWAHSILTDCVPTKYKA